MVSGVCLSCVSFVHVTFKCEFCGHCFSSSLVQVYNSHLRTGLTQSVSKCSAYALPSTCYVGHLSIKTHPLEDGAPLDPTENLIICYFTLTTETRQA